MLTTTVKEEVKKSLKQTSIKGVPRLFHETPLYMKLLWICAIISFLAAGYYQSYQLVKEFFSFPKLTFVREHDSSVKSDFTFPNIQVCNINPMGSFRNLPENESFEHYGQLVINITTCNNCSEEDRDILQKARGSLVSLYGYKRFLGFEKVSQLMTNYTDFMIECLLFTLESYVGTKCENMAKITIVHSFEYLLCLKVEVPQDIIIDKASMTFYIDSFETDMTEYNSVNIWATKSTGVAYAIYQANSKMEVDYTNPTAPPGVITSIKIKKQVYTRLEEPYGDCLEEEDSFGYCNIKCKSEVFLKYCQCSVSSNMNTTKKYNPCASATLPQERLLQLQKCVMKSRKSVVKECTSKCRQRCSEIKYIQETSYTKWPLPHQFHSFYETLLKSKPYSKLFEVVSNFNENNTMNFSKPILKLLQRQLINDNFVRIDFLINNKVYHEFTEVPKYTTFSFIGTLGGALNLWTGITVVVMIEICELLMNIVMSLNGPRRTVKVEEKY